MAESEYKIVYWGAVAFYAIALTGILLYLRFPEQAFRRYCENRIERLLPEFSCAIDKVGFGFPVELVFQGIRLQTQDDEQEVLFNDSRLAFQPDWKNLTEAVLLTSKAFGGQHQARIRFAGASDIVALEDIQITEIDLGEIELIGEKLNREVGGVAAAEMEAVIEKETKKIIEAKGTIDVKQGDIALKGPILGMRRLALDEASVRFTIENNRLVVSEGEAAGEKITALFQGDVTLAGSLFASALNLNGSLEPRPSLIRENRQVQAVMARMRQNNQNGGLPFMISGTIRHPTFVFRKK